MNATIKNKGNLPTTYMDVTIMRAYLREAHKQAESASRWLTEHRNLAKDTRQYCYAGSYREAKELRRLAWQVLDWAGDDWVWRRKMYNDMKRDAEVGA